ncbi:predicted protein [Nematostella vectensis]|uniref:G-protein coupled receptors family 1 profile domain-containing protein n=1 Tax=Nematostella vectensis TaxID=45351 RepID=A7RY86_NEMVE|nr:predicted protein [Nematostella vectensis]|eukprot:XP_001635657.1 predicted protein [Nematostella vectensis]
MADVTPLPKKKQVVDLQKELRPISLTPVVSKVSEDLSVLNLHTSFSELLRSDILCGHGGAVGVGLVLDSAGTFPVLLDRSWSDRKSGALIKKEELVLFILFVVIAAFGLLGNLLVCLNITKNRPVRRPINWLFLNLAISDITILVFLAVMYIIVRVVSHPRGPTCDALCKFLTAGNIAWVGVVSSTCSLVCIALERFHMVFKPTRHKSLFRVVSAKRGIALSWVFGVLINIPLFVVERFDAKILFCSEAWPSSIASRYYTVTWLAVVIIIPGILMFFLYWRIIRFVAQ